MSARIGKKKMETQRERESKKILKEYELAKKALGRDPSVQDVRERTGLSYARVYGVLSARSLPITRMKELGQLECQADPEAWREKVGMNRSTLPTGQFFPMSSTTKTEITNVAKKSVAKKREEEKEDELSSMPFQLVASILPEITPDMHIVVRNCCRCYGKIVKWYPEPFDFVEEGKYKFAICESCRRRELNAGV